MSEIPSNQELFDRAWNGLKSQNFTRAFLGDSCQYAVRDAEGTVVKRCAWGWADPEGTEGCGAVVVGDLAYDGIGLAGRLRAAGFLQPRSGLALAKSLQQAHDGATDVDEGDVFGMQARLRKVAADYGLTVPA